MASVISAQLCQLFRTKLKFITLILCLVVEIALTVGMTPDNGDDQTGWMSILIGWSSMGIVVFLYIAASVGDICAGDFNDKTLYIELMSGCTRNKCYFGRLIVSIIFTLPTALFLYAAPLLVSRVIFGSTNIVPISGLLTRIGLLVLPTLRLICMFTCISFIAKHRLGVFAIGFCMLEAFSVATTFIVSVPNELLALTSASYFCSFDEWSSVGLNGGLTFITDDRLADGMIGKIALWSIAASALFALIGWHSFRSDDLN